MGVEWPANSVFRWGACKLPVIRRVWHGFRNPAESFALKCGSAARGLLLRRTGSVLAGECVRASIVVRFRGHEFDLRGAVSNE